VAGAVDLRFDKLMARLRQESGAGTFCVDEQGQVVFINTSGQAIPITS
jgi:hypothetical protein